MCKAKNLHYLLFQNIMYFYWSKLLNNSVSFFMAWQCLQCNVFNCFFRYQTNSTILNCQKRNIFTSYFLQPFLSINYQSNREVEPWFNEDNCSCYYFSSYHNFCSKNLSEAFTDSVGWIFRWSNLLPLTKHPKKYLAAT